MFMDGPELTRPSEVETFDSSTRLSVNISAFGEQAKFSTGLDKMGDVIARAVSAYEDVEYVPQQRDSLMALLLGTAWQTKENRGIPKDTYRALHSQGRVAAFVDPRTWLAHLAGRDFVFGSRLHGAIAGLLAGTPAHLIAHDSRTLELAQYHEVPHTRIDAMADDQGARDLYESSDYSAMVTGHARRFATYAQFLQNNGLRNVFSDGDSGAAFEAQMAKVDLPPPIVSSLRWRQRLPWVREHLLPRRPTRAGDRPHLG
jgi:hypothetical protein